jgi:regulator of sigma E protease
MSFAISILAVGLLIAIHEGGHFVAARRVGMTVLRYSIGFFYPILAWTSKKTGIIYQVGILPLGGFVQIKGMNPFEEGAYKDADSYQLMAVWRRMLVVVAGPLANLLLAWLLLFGLYSYGFPQQTYSLEVEKVVANSPAEKAGIQRGDLVETFENHQLKTWTELVMALQGSPEKEVTLGLVRDGDSRNVKVTPERVGDVGKVGIFPVAVVVPMRSLSPIDAATISTIHFWQKWVVQTGHLLAALVSREATGARTMGPVGIVKEAANKLKTGFPSFLALAAYLSFMLGLFNLLPLPALDGGRAVFLIIEGISRKPIHPKVDAIVNTVGFFLLMGMLVLMTFKDIFG